MTLSDERLLELNLQGLIPGPRESEVTFLDRSDRCLHLKETIVTELKNDVPFVQDEIGTVTVLEEAFPTTQRLFDMAPTWIPLFFSNYQLMPWHGGCAWIFQMTPETPPMAFFQLRRRFAAAARYLGLYHRKELVAHELAHVGRMAFEEPQFEEILAYRTSSSGFRRWVGPLLQSSYEALILLGLLFLCGIVDAFALVSANSSALTAALWWKLLPAAYLSYLLMRLSWRHHHFSRCRVALGRLLKTEQAIDAVLFRLTDVEIHRLGRFGPEQLACYAEQQAERSLRWRLIWRAYFFRGLSER